MTWIATALTFARKVPAWAYLAAGAVLALFMAYQLGKSAERAECKLEQAQAVAKAVERARQADTAASDAVKGTTDAVEQGNERAREAAAGGDDPLLDGFNSLRSEARNRPAAR